MLVMTAEPAGAAAPLQMGDAISLADGQTLPLAINVAGCPGWTLQLLDNGKLDANMPAAALTTPNQTVHARWRSDGKRHWILPEVVNASGELELLGNPIYVNLAPQRGDPGRL